MAILRSPYAHARIRSIDTSAARGAAGRRRRRHRRAVGPVQPRLDADPVRATPRPCSPPTRCASRARRSPASSPRIATWPTTRSSSSSSTTSRYRAIVDPYKALEDGAPLIRDEKEEQTDNRVLPLGSGRPRGHRGGVRLGRQGREPRHALPALPPGAARVLRLRRRCQPRLGKGDDLHDVAGAPRHPHGVRDRHRPPRAEHPDHLARHRRRLRQQGSHLPGLRRRHGRVAAHRPPGEVDRGPHRQPHLDGLRPRLPHARRAGGERGRPDAGPARQDAVRPGLRLCRCPTVEVQGGPVPHRHRLLRHARGAHRLRTARTRTRRPAASPIAARSGHRGVVPDRAPRVEHRLRARTRPGRVPAQELHPARAVPVHLGHRLRVRLRRLRGSDGSRPRPGSATPGSAPSRAGGGRTAPTTSCSASASPRSPRPWGRDRAATTTSSA